MEISANTVNILKNFSAINGNIVIKPGNKLMTISEAKNVLAEAQVPEEFNSIVGIYDLNEFLNVLGLVDKPRVRFEDNYMNIGGQSGRELVKYYYADTEMLTSPTKPIEMPDISTKEKAQEFIGLDMEKLESEKADFKKNVLPKWLEAAKAREDKMPVNTVSATN